VARSKDDPMKVRRGLSKLLVEPASVATGDIAFNLIVFFLVCASTQPDSGRKQDLPKSESKQQQQSKNIEVMLARLSQTIDGSTVELIDFRNRLRSRLSGVTRDEDRVVVVKSSPDVPYFRWIEITGLIEEAGGIVTLQLEEERTVFTPQ